MAMASELVEAPLSSQQQRRAQPVRRNIALDVLRGVAILAVVNNHFQDRFKSIALEASSPGLL